MAKKTKKSNGAFLSQVARRHKVTFVVAVVVALLTSSVWFVLMQEQRAQGIGYYCPARSDRGGRPSLGPGSRDGGRNHRCVAHLQAALNQLNRAGLRVDGVYGRQTEMAVKGFQYRAGLRQDGRVGPQTWGIVTQGGCYYTTRVHNNVNLLGRGYFFGQDPKNCERAFY